MGSIVLHEKIFVQDLRHTQGWSTASLEESDNEDEFLPMRLPGSTSMSDSIASNNTSMDGSVLSSSISLKNSATSLPKQQKHRHSMDNSASTAETSHFHVRVSSIAVILLHEDILTTCVEGGGLTCSSIQQMKNSADDFFKQLGMFAAGGYGNKDFDKASKILLDACHLSHIRYDVVDIINNDEVSCAGKTVTNISSLIVDYLLHP